MPRRGLGVVNVALAFVYTGVVLARSASGALKYFDYLVAEAAHDSLGELERDPMASHVLRGRLTSLRCNVATLLSVYAAVASDPGPDPTARRAALADDQRTRRCAP